MPARENTAHPGLYIHVPFCRAKCPYCDFYSTDKTGLIDSWLTALEREAALYARLGMQFDTVYVGGGSPSILSRRRLDRLVKCLRSGFHVLPDAEWTVEMNPRDVTDEAVADLYALGFNRISLGVQSFADEELTLLGRRHSAARALWAAEAVQRSPISQLSLDLIYGLPGQSAGRWAKTLQKAVSLKPAHLSCYQLTVKERTPFFYSLQRGDFEMPDDTRQEQLFRITSRLLEQRGFIHYEISNFARAPNCISRHNSKYWSHIPYLGLGPASHSFVNSSRWYNSSSVTAYIRALSAGRPPVVYRERVTPEKRRCEQLLLAFRTRAGIDKDVFQAAESTKKMLGTLAEQGFVSVSGSRVVPTVRGYLYADSLAGLLA